MIPHEADEEARKEFVSLLGEGSVESLKGSVVQGVVVMVEGNQVSVDIGLKMEGLIPLEEFTSAGEEVSRGTLVEVFVEHMETRRALCVLSRQRVRNRKVWAEMEELFEAGKAVEGSVESWVKGGFTVKVRGILGFLPGSQSDLLPGADSESLVGTTHLFRILKMDRAWGNIIVSRRAVSDEGMEEEKATFLSELKEGQVLQGVVKNITNYGVFVDLGRLDGLVHITDMSYKRLSHPSELVEVGQSVDVQVLYIQSDKKRIGLGIKQLKEDPWDCIEEKYKVGEKYTGRVTNIIDYGAFVELEPGIEGLIYVTEMSWGRRAEPSKIVSTSEEVEVVLLGIDKEKRRISMSLRQAVNNPWMKFQEENPVGTKIRGQVQSISDFGLFIALEGEEDMVGMVHMSDLSWDKDPEQALNDYRKSQEIEACILEVDLERMRINLGVKQLTEDPFQKALDLELHKRVTGVVASVNDAGITLTLSNGMRGFVRRGDISSYRDNQRTNRFAVGDKVDAKITSINEKTRRIFLSIKAVEIEDEKEAMKTYGSKASGALLGSILGEALGGEGKKEEEEDSSEKRAVDDAQKKKEGTPSSEKRAVDDAQKKKEGTPSSEKPAVDDAQKKKEGTPSSEKPAIDDEKKKKKGTAKATEEKGMG